MNSRPERRLQDLNTRFGAEAVSADGRKVRVRALFGRIAPSYDLMNDLMSGGLHRLWKRRAVAAAVARVAGIEGPLLDLAAGTGDIARLLAERLAGRAVVRCDASFEMLAAGLRREAGTRLAVAAEGESLPFSCGRFAAVTLSFGLRNMTDPAACLAEVHRVLSPGGSLVILEFSQPDAWFAPLYRFTSRTIIPRLGAAVARDRSAYAYLIDSIAAFPDAASVSAALATAGFEVATVERLVFGAVAIHVAIKTREAA